MKQKKEYANVDERAAEQADARGFEVVRHLGSDAVVVAQAGAQCRTGDAGRWPEPGSAADKFALALETAPLCSWADLNTSQQCHGLSLRRMDRSLARLPEAVTAVWLYTEDRNIDVQRGILNMLVCAAVLRMLQRVMSEDFSCMYFHHEKPYIFVKFHLGRDTRRIHQGACRTQR